MDSGMDEDEYEDYLVDKAKEILNQDLSEASDEGVKKPEMKRKRNEMDEKVEKDSTSKIPFSWDPREVKHLTKNRHKMDNDEMEKFLKKDTEFHEKMEEIEEWNGFSRWEERFLVQNPGKEPEELSERLGRDKQEVELKMHMLGIRSVR